MPCRKDSRIYSPGPGPEPPKFQPRSRSEILCFIPAKATATDMAGPPVLNETVIEPPVSNLLGVCAMPVVENPDVAGLRPEQFWFSTTGNAQTPNKFDTDGPTTVSFNTGGPAISVAVAFADYK
jgi:hypothetical protein